MGELNMINEPLSPSIYESWNDVYLNNNVWELPWVNKEIHPELKKLIDSLPIKSGNALDVGCGLGQVSRYLAKVGFDVTAIDISEEAIRLSRELNDTGKHIDYLVANSINFQSEAKFDLIVDFLHLHDIQINHLHNYIENLEKTINDSAIWILYFLKCNKTNFTHRKSYYWDHNIYFYNYEELINNTNAIKNFNILNSIQVGSNKEVYYSNGIMINKYA
jgi:SAM-dependent methyltransferase